jgi:hypothetical protein
MSGASYVPYSDVYEERVPYQDQPHASRRVQNIPREDIDAVRRRQLEDFYRPASPREVMRNDRRGRRDRSAPHDYYSSRRRRNYSSSRSSSDNEEDYEERRRQEYGDPHRRDYFHRQRTQSEMRNTDEPKGRHYDGYLRSRAKSVFDSSGNGILAAAAGAGIGAITARRFADRNPYDSRSHEASGRERLKTLGGAIAGGLIANAAEERFRRWTAEKEEAKQQQ